MKRILSLALAATLVCFSLSATQLETVVFDAPRLLQESAEGKVFADKINKKVADFQEFAKSSYDKITNMQKEVDAKSKALSKEALQEKVEEINQKKKDLERTIADKKDVIEKEIEKEKARLGQKFMEIAKTLFDKEGWGLLLERNMPGVVCVAEGKDVTDKLVLAVNDAYSKQEGKTKAKTTLAKNTTPSKKTIHA